MFIQCKGTDGKSILLINTDNVIMLVKMENGHTTIGFNLPVVTTDDDGTEEEGPFEIEVGDTYEDLRAKLVAVPPVHFGSPAKPGVTPEKASPQASQGDAGLRLEEVHGPEGTGQEGRSR